MNRRFQALEWLGFSRVPDFAKSRLFGSIIGVIISGFAILIAIGAAMTLLQSVSVVLVSGAEHDAIRNTGLVLFAIIGFPFVVWRAMVAQQQADIAQQNHITEQINKAVLGLGSEKVVTKIGRPVKILTGNIEEFVLPFPTNSGFELPERSIELGRYQTWERKTRDDEPLEETRIEVKQWAATRTAIEWQGVELAIDPEERKQTEGDWTVFSETQPNIEVRLGAIYALERIAQDSIRDHIQIMDTLAAFVRENSPLQSAVQFSDEGESVNLRTDVQVALDVLGRRTAEGRLVEAENRHRLDLSSCNLIGAKFTNGNFDGVRFSGCKLQFASFEATSLQGSLLDYCNLNKTSFLAADLTGAILDHSEMLVSRSLFGSFLPAKKTIGMSLAGADLSAVHYLPTFSGHSMTFGTRDTKLPARLRSALEDTKDDRELYFDCHYVDENCDDKLVERLNASGFKYWSLFKSSDFEALLLRTDMKKRLGLTGFPFDD